MVLGKRSKCRKVPLPDLSVETMQAAARRSLGPDPLANDPPTPLIRKLSAGRSVSTALTCNNLVAALERCASHIWGRDRRAAEWSREASTHCPRHSYGSHSVARGVPQANPGQSARRQHDPRTL